jgi:hypothetical protein
MSVGNGTTEPTKPLQQSLATLVEWSKWLMGVGLAAAVGCITVLNLGTTEEQRDRLVYATCCFLFSLAFAAALGLMVSWAKGELVPSRRAIDGAWCLAVLQFVALAIGGLYVFAWVRNVKPVSGNPAPTSQPADDIVPTVQAILGAELQRIGIELQQSASRQSSQGPAVVPAVPTPN